MPDDTAAALAALAESYGLAYSKMLEIVTANVDLISGTIDDPASYDADGKPSTDPTHGPLGFYPVNFAPGPVIFLPCYRLLQSAAAALETLPDAAGGDAGATNKIVGVTADGTAKLFPVAFFATPRIQDQANLVDLLGNELLPAYASGGNKKIEAAAIGRMTTGMINPKLPPYNCKGDAVRAERVGTTNGSPRVTLAEPLFLPSDQGKKIMLSNAAGGVPKLATLQTYVSSTQFDMDSNATTTVVPVTGYQQAIWGTDDTTGMQAAIDACKPRGTFDRGGCLWLPPGMFLVKPLKYYARMAIFGAGPRVSILVRMRDGTANPVLRNNSTLDDFPILFNFGIHGAKYCQYPSAGGSGLQFISVDGSVATAQSDPYPRFEQIDIFEAGYNGLETYGRFSGDIRTLNIYQANNYGWWNRSYDMNVLNMLVIGCTRTGVVFGGESANNNINNLKVSFNGTDALYNYNPVGGDSDATKIAKDLNKRREGANVLLQGVGHNITNARLQESATSNLVMESSFSKLGHISCDDTGCISTKHSAGGTRPRVVAAVDFISNLASSNLMFDVAYGSSVHSGDAPNDDYLSHGVYFSGNAGANKGRIWSKASTAYISPRGGENTGAYAPSAFGTDSSGGYGSNHVFLDESLIA